MTTRRDLFKITGGAAVGALLTPAPWRMITDGALWSENWPGIPRPARGEIRAKFTNCTLCPAGCAMKARCVGDQPISLAGVAGHPLSHGALCPFGIAGHHLPYHPERLLSGAVEDAAAAIKKGIGEGGRIAVFDTRPGRTASWTYRRAMASLPGGLYLRPQAALNGNAVDLSAARTVLSFGVPLLDGWGTPGNVIQARGNFRLIQVEAIESRTAAMADLWLPTNAGEERAMASIILNGGMDHIARELENGPVLVLGPEDWPEIVELNRKYGALGRTIVSRRDAPVPDTWKDAAPEMEWADAAEGSIRVLLIDETAPGAYVPWHSLETKLSRDAVVVAFTATRDGYARHAQFSIPTAVFPEALDDIPAAVDSPAGVFRLSTSLVPPAAGTIDPAMFIARLAGIDAASALRDRAGAICRSARGNVFHYADSKSTPMKEMKADAFWKSLNEGACWIDDLDPKAPAPKLVARAATRASNVSLVETCGAGLVSPLFSKLHEESHVRLARHEIALNPAGGFHDGERVALQTDCGRIAMTVLLDPSIPPGSIQAATGADVLDLCGGVTGAKVVRI